MDEKYIVASAVRVVARRREEPLELVKSVDMTFRPGDVTAIVGETGCGKSMTARAMVGLLPANLERSGTLQLGGIEYDLADDAGLAGIRGEKISWVPQNPAQALNPLMRIDAQLIEPVVRRGAMTKDMATARANDLLSELGFTHPTKVLHAYPHEISGGMAQRVVIVGALMQHPQILIADEPTSALDASLRVEVLEMFRSLAKSHGTAVVVISHDLHLIGKQCDRIYVMYSGRVVEHGAVQPTLRRPVHPYTDALRKTSLTLAAHAKTPPPYIQGTPPSPGVSIPGCAFAPRCKRRIATCEIHLPNLEPAGESDSFVACHVPLTGALT